MQLDVRVGELEGCVVRAVSVLRGEAALLARQVLLAVAAPGEELALVGGEDVFVVVHLVADEGAFVARGLCVQVCQAERQAQVFVGRACVLRKLEPAYVAREVFSLDAVGLAVGGQFYLRALIHEGINL